uniref:Antimicrobial peptide 1 n=1 Tax=Anthurium amnicola TaxID=1678845 RepID=A0A1D1XUJ9_9ARAE
MAAEKRPLIGTLSIIMLVATAVLVLAAAPAEGSYMTAWAGPGCSNRAQRYSACGCTNINLHGGYEFVYQGQTAATYNQANCRGVAHTRFSSSTRGCRAFGWRSIFIQC